MRCVEHQRGLVSRPTHRTDGKKRMSNYFLVLLAVAVRLWPEGRFWPPAPMVKAEAAPAVAVAKLSREESHSLQAATTLSTSSAEPHTLREALGRGVQEGD